MHRFEADTTETTESRLHCWSSWCQNILFVFLCYWFILCIAVL